MFLRLHDAQRLAAVAGLRHAAVTAGHDDVPVIMVTGDEAACREARRRRERRLGPNPASLDTPWFVEHVSEVRGAMDIIRDSTND